MDTSTLPDKRPVFACTLRAFSDPVYLEGVKAILPEGVEIVGNGTCPHPMDVKLSPARLHAPELLAACNKALAFLFPDIDTLLAEGHLNAAANVRELCDELKRVITLATEEKEVANG